MLLLSWVILHSRGEAQTQPPERTKQNVENAPYKNAHQNLWENTEVADSLRFKSLNAFYKKNTLSNPDDVIAATEIHYELGSKSQNHKEQIKALSERSYAYFVKDNAQKAEEALKEAIRIQIGLDDRNALAGLYTNLASIYRSQGNFVETIKYYNYSLSIFETNHNESVAAAVLGNLGLVFYDLKNFEIAAYYFERSLLLYKKLKLQDEVGYISLYTGAVEYENGNYAKAISLAESALKLFEKENNLLSMADCHALLAKTYQKTNNREKTLSEINKSIAINARLNNLTKTIQNKVFMAEHYLDYDVPMAIQLGEEVLKLIHLTADKDAKARLYHLLHKAYKKTNKVERSQNMYDAYVQYNDSLVKEQSNLDLIKTAVSQEYDLKILKQKKAYDEAKKTLYGTYSAKIVALLVLFVLLVVAVFYYFRKKQRTERAKTLELVEEIERLKNSTMSISSKASDVFVLHRTKVEKAISRKLNDTDWAVLNVLADNPVISNKELAAKVFLSVDGVGSSLRRMYDHFEIEESKYKKTDLIRKVIAMSNAD